MGIDELVVFGGVLVWVIGAIVAAIKKGKAAAPAQQAAVLTGGGAKVAPKPMPKTGLKPRRERPQHTVKQGVGTRDALETPSQKHPPAARLRTNADGRRGAWTPWQRALVMSEVLGKPRATQAHEPPA